MTAVRSRRLLIGLVLTGLAMRVAGSGFGLRLDGTWTGPWHPDEVTWVAAYLWPDLNTRYLYYGTLHIYLLFLLNVLFYLAAKFLGVSVHLDYKAFVWNTEAARYLIARGVSALAGAAAIAAMQRIGERLWSRRAGWIAALLMLVTPTGVVDSHYATVDAAFLLWCLLAYFFCFRVYERGETRDYRWAALFLGLAIGTKYNGGMLVFMFYLAHSLGARRRGGSPAAALADLRWLWTSAVFTAIFLAGNPFVVLDYDTFHAQLTHNIRLDAAFQAGKGPSALEGYAAYGKIFGNWLGYAVLACAAGGLAVEARRDARRAAVLAILPISYFLVVGSFGERVPRHMMPAIPPTLLLAAAFLDFLWTRAAARIPGRPVRAALATAALLAVLWTPAAYSLHKLTIVSGDDNRIAARRWIEGNIPEGARVLVDRNNEYSPLVDPKRYVVGRHDFKGKDDAASFEDVVAGGWQYVVASSMMYHVNNPLDTAGFYEDLDKDRRSMLLKVFRGEDMTDNFHNPELKIYRVQPDAIVLEEAEPDPDGYFVHDSGNMYLFDVSPRYASDNQGAPQASRLAIFEDGRPLGPAHTPVTQIIEKGGGRFAHWEGVLYFSTSDNSDPNRNGRKYAVRETETKVMIEEELDADGYFKNDAGYAYLFDVPSESPGDDEADGRRSRLVVYEDGVPLGPPHAAHDEVRKAGRGRFSHWRNKVYFSTSDNTNPNVNGRRYTVRISKR